MGPGVTEQAKALFWGPWKGSYGVLGFSESDERVLLFWRRRDIEQQLSACGLCDSLGGSHIR